MSLSEVEAFVEHAEYSAVGEEWGVYFFLSFILILFYSDSSFLFTS